MSSSLKATLNGWHLWGLAVGLVISGEYFGWSYGWDKAGTLGFLVTSILIAVMYTTFIFSFTELTTSSFFLSSSLFFISSFCFLGLFAFGAFVADLFVFG